MINEEKGFKRFQKLMNDLAASYLVPIVGEIQKGNIANVDPKRIEVILFNGYMEISNILDSLAINLKFISLEPPKEEKINYSDYLNYHIHFYLQEIYILKERLNKYATDIQRRYRNTGDQKIIENLMDSLYKLIKSALDSITATKIGVRNIHVHNEKFYNEELQGLSTITFLASQHEEYQSLSEDLYKKTKEKWFEQIKKNNLEVNVLIDLYFDALYAIINLQDKINLPKSSR